MMLVTEAVMTSSNMNGADADWLEPEPSSTSIPAVEPAFDGVIRVDDPIEQGLRFATLAAALKAAPPASPESVIYGRDGMLAECHPDLCRWVLLTPGHARLAAEAKPAKAKHRHDFSDGDVCSVCDALRRSA
jgi:hypothetical protein